LNRKNIFFIPFFLFVSSLLYSATLSNEYLVVDVENETGRIFLSTTGGKVDIVGDEKTNLLFYDKPHSSYTLIYVNDDAYIFGSQRGVFTKKPINIDNSIEAVWENNIIRVKEAVRFIERKKTGIEDGVLIKYDIYNKTDSNLEIGLGIVLDTYLGEKGVYHFLISDGTKIKFETEIVRENMPLYWESLDNIDNSVVGLRGILKGKNVTLPDRLVFANWRSLGENIFDYKVLKRKKFDYLPYSKNDSAVKMFFNGKITFPLGTQSFKTILSLCDEGEYSEEVYQIVEFKEEKLEFAKKKKEDIIIIEKPLEKINISLIESEIESLKKIKISLSKINSLINEINKVLKREDKKISGEEENRLKMTINELPF